MKPTNGMRSFINDCFKLNSLTIHLVGKGGGFIHKTSDHETENFVFVERSLLYTTNSKNHPDH